MVSEPDIGRCASLGGCPPKGVDTRRCASKDAGHRKGVELVVVLHRLEGGGFGSGPISIGERNEDARP